jgi:hypothetical protein
MNENLKKWRRKWRENLPTYLPICLSTYISSCCSHWNTGNPWNASFHFSFLILVGRTPWTGDQPVARPLPTHKHRIDATYMPWVGFESTILMFELAKIFNSLDLAATMIGRKINKEKSWWCCEERRKKEKYGKSGKKCRKKTVVNVEEYTGERRKRKTKSYIGPTWRRTEFA